MIMEAALATRAKTQYVPTPVCNLKDQLRRCTSVSGKGTRRQPAPNGALRFWTARCPRKGPRTAPVFFEGPFREAVGVPQQSAQVAQPLKRCGPRRFTSRHRPSHPGGVVRSASRPRSPVRRFGDGLKVIATVYVSVSSHVRASWGKK